MQLGTPFLLASIAFGKKQQQVAGFSSSSSIGNKRRSSASVAAYPTKTILSRQRRRQPRQHHQAGGCSDSWQRALGTISTYESRWSILSRFRGGATATPNNGKAGSTELCATPTTASIEEQDNIPGQTVVPDPKAASKLISPTEALAKFLTVFFKGVTLPFPTLRKLANSQQQQQSKASSSQEHKNKARVGFSVRESLLAIAVYLALGVVSYGSTILQHDKAWSLVDALYFGVVTFTSVGYGDLCPSTTAGKMFTILFGLSGIALLGAAIATIGSRIMEQENEMIRAAQEASRKQMLQLFQAFASISHASDGDQVESKNRNDAQQENANNNTLAIPSDKAQKQEIRQGVPLWRQTIANLLKKSVPAILALLVGGTIMGRIEGWSLTDSIYYSFITAGTLGYGDFSPISRQGRLWGIVFIPLAVASAGEVLGNVASAIMERRQKYYYETLMERELDMKRLVEMDTDNDGQVSREEYVQFILKEMELVSEEQFEELHAQFRRLDVDGGGYLDKEDLKVKLGQQEKKTTEATTFLDEKSEKQ